MKATQTNKQPDLIQELYNILSDTAAVNECKIPNLADYYEARFMLNFEISLLVSDIDYCIKYKGRRILEGRIANESEKDQLEKLRRNILSYDNLNDLAGMLHSVLKAQELIETFRDLQTAYDRILEAAGNLKDILFQNPFAVITKTERAAMPDLFSQN